VTWLLVAQIIASAPPVTPAAAAAVMARLDSPANVTGLVLGGDGPRVVLIRSSATAGPFAKFPKPPAFRPLNCCSLYINGFPISGGRYGLHLSTQRPSHVVGSSTAAPVAGNTNRVTARLARTPNACCVCAKAIRPKGFQSPHRSGVSSSLMRSRTS
jgi:hypothetical protein